MMVLIIKKRSLIKCLLAAAAAIALLFALSTSGMDALGVSSVNRLLPVYCVEMQEKKAAITFDCAWGADDIPAILKTLEEEKVKATFFIVGLWADKFPDKVRMIGQNGHDIANHSYSHFRMGVLDREKVSSEIVQCGDKLEMLTGKKPDLFRAPYGDFGGNVVETAKKLGYFTIQWNLDSLDWRPGISRQEILERIRTRIKPGSIILFHNDTPHTAELLPEIIASLKDSGYKLVPVSELIMRENYYIDFDGTQRKKT